MKGDYVFLETPMNKWIFMFPLVIFSICFPQYTGFKEGYNCSDQMQLL